MNRYSKNLLLVLSVSLSVVASLPSDAAAQRIGNGRVLRRIFGLEVEEDLAAKAAAEAAAEAAARAEAKKKAAAKAKPTPANPYSVTPRTTHASQQPPRRGAPPRVNVVPDRPLPQPPEFRSPATRSDGNQSTSPANTYAKRGEPNRLPTQSPASEFSIAKPQDTRKTVEHDPFGITVRMRGKYLTIYRVKRSGTADAAGIEIGDTLLSVGEIPMQRPADIEQLDEVLKAGDQVEFEIVRKGKKSKKLVAFKRVASLESSPKDADEIDEAQEPLTLEPTPAGPMPLDANSDGTKETIGYRDFEKTDQVDALRKQIESQQQIIERLEWRLNQLEQIRKPANSVAPPARRGTAQQGPILLPPTD